jgi:uncharacterized protein (DUF983 family)
VAPDGWWGRAARILGRSLRLACPRCGRTRLFAGWFVMAPACTRCGLRFERAQGYFVGAIYVNYGVTATVVMAGGLLLWRYAGIAPARQLWLWAPFAVLFPVWFFRYSRSLWLGIEYLVNPQH